MRPVSGDHLHRARRRSLHATLCSDADSHCDGHHDADPTNSATATLTDTPTTTDTPATHTDRDTYYDLLIERRYDAARLDFWSGHVTLAPRSDRDRRLIAPSR